VDFTKLEIAHLPAREKREEEIRLYKQKQAAAAALTDSIDIADRQPVFLKDKGDVLFKQNNFHAAVNAYTKAIELEGEDSMCTLKCRCAHIPELIMFAKIALPKLTDGASAHQHQECCVSMLSNPIAPLAHGRVKCSRQSCMQYESGCMPRKDRRAQHMHVRL
jgi:hypothetical protein